MTILNFLTALTSLLLAETSQPDMLELRQLTVHTNRLAQRVTELAGADDLLDTLHFGWFDRPYARATLAVLVKTTSTLQREVRLRELGNGAVSDSTLRAILVWAEEALERVLTSESDDTFRPHRLHIGAGKVAGASAGPPLYGFVDRTTSTRRDRRFGDLDLVAAMGMRAYSTLARDPVLAQTDGTVFQRTDALGMAVVSLAAGGTEPGGRLFVPADSVSSSVLSVRSVTLRGLLQGGGNRTGLTLAVVHPVRGESPGGWLARGGLARGALGGTCFIVDSWQVPRFGGSVRDRSAATAAAMWVSAIEGQSLGLLRGWRDIRDGSGSPYASVLLDPRYVETVAHTALDLIRLGESVSRFWGTPPLAVAVDSDAVDARNGNVWADWLEPIWAALLDRQIRFDVVSLAGQSSSSINRYEVVFPLRRDEIGDIASLMLRLERALAAVDGHVNRVTVHEPDGELAAEVLVRDARTADDSVCVAVVDVSGRSRLLKLRGGARLDALRDVISNSVISRPNDRIDLAPWQVRLLWPAQ